MKAFVDYCLVWLLCLGQLLSFRAVISSVKTALQSSSTSGSVLASPAGEGTAARLPGCVTSGSSQRAPTQAACSLRAATGHMLPLSRHAEA
ncbi:hypothetical protein AAFF_G00093570 [Aldrovandia affinis]|uniref:Secreted protein n=1 Tax=Aldrovandia affinis TaxID=143900 RepID=A0AAD7T4L3_9TELE|nr:hypothetical protein AAFF_G00093570 [Aldrovandia affinis]